MRNTTTIKKVLLGAVLIITYGIYAIRQHITQANSSIADIPTAAPITGYPSLLQSTPTPTITTSPITGPNNMPITIPTATPTATPSGQYKDGQYTGITANAFYGPLQIVAIIQNGKLTDIQFVQYPNDRHESLVISNYALPILRTEAITAQSANVDRVTGASQSSRAFIETLDSALQQAHS